MVEISVSLLSSNPKEMEMDALIKRVEDIEEADADSFHIDVMDGDYNPNRTWEQLGPSVINEIRDHTTLPLTAHLMINDPLEKIGLFDCDRITFHFEACRAGNVWEVVKKVQYHGKEVGIALEPDTDIRDIIKYLPVLDEVLVMTVQTGYSNQKFIDKTDKINFLSRMRDMMNFRYKIAVDGGINDITGRLCRDVGADILVSATYVLRHPNGYRFAIDSLRG